MNSVLEGCSHRSAETGNIHDHAIIRAKIRIKLKTDNSQETKSFNYLKLKDSN